MAAEKIDPKLQRTGGPHFEEIAAKNKKLRDEARNSRGGTGRIIRKNGVTFIGMKSDPELVSLVSAIVHAVKEGVPIVKFQKEVNRICSNHSV